MNLMKSDKNPERFVPLSSDLTSVLTCDEIVTSVCVCEKERVLFIERFRVEKKNTLPNARDQ